MPAGIIAQSAHTPNPNANLIGRAIIPNDRIVNPRGFHPIIWGYNLPWNTSFFLSKIRAPIFYITHVLKLKWGSQVNQYRGAWSVN